MRELQHRACEKYARDGRPNHQRTKPRTKSTQPQPDGTDREVERRVEAVLRKMGFDSSASTRAGGDRSSRSYREAAGGSPDNRNNSNTTTRTPHTNDGNYSNTNSTANSNNTHTASGDGTDGSGDGDSIQQAIADAKEMVGDLELQLKSAKADARHRSTEGLVRKEQHVQKELDEAKAELGKLLNKTRNTSDRLEYTYKRIKQLEKAQEKEIGKCRTAVAAIQAAEADWDAARKEHQRMAHEITSLNAQADELRPPAQAASEQAGGPKNLAEMAAAMRSRLQAIDAHRILDEELRKQSTVEFAQFETFMAFFEKASLYEQAATARIQAAEAQAKAELQKQKDMEAQQTQQQQQQQQLLQQQQQQQPTTTTTAGSGAEGEPRNTAAPPPGRHPGYTSTRMCHPALFPQ